MSDESEVARLREQVSQMEKDRVKGARRMATAFGLLAIIGLIAGVYGYVQQVSAERNREQAVHFERMALQAEGNALQARDMAEVAQKKVEQLTIELEICRAVKK